MNKKSKVIIAILSVLVVSLGLTLIKIYEKYQPELIGSYQSEAGPPDIYLLSFFKDGTYEIYERSILVDEGEYESAGTDEAYTIKSDKENQLLVLNKDDAFYYYSPDNKVYHMKNVDKNPVSLGQPE